MYYYVFFKGFCIMSFDSRDVTTNHEHDSICMCPSGGQCSIDADESVRLKKISLKLIYQEVLCHLPFTVLSIILSIVILSFMYFNEMLSSAQENVVYAYHVLFHVFHYIHILFAVIGTYLMFTRFSGRKIWAIVISLLVPAVFCTFSDAILPAVAGTLLGVEMDMHICFFYPDDLFNMIIFLLVGLLCAYALKKKQSTQASLLSFGMHFCHIFASSLAALFYMVSYGFDGWVDSLGMLFVYLIFCVMIPCVMSDLVVPLYLARKLE
jgi:hypothetical protein